MEGTSSSARSGGGRAGCRRDGATGRSGATAAGRMQRPPPAPPERPAKPWRNVSLLLPAPPSPFGSPSSSPRMPKDGVAHRGNPSAPGRSLFLSVPISRAAWTCAAGRESGAAARGALFSWLVDRRGRLKPPPAIERPAKRAPHPLAGSRLRGGRRLAWTRRTRNLERVDGMTRRVRGRRRPGCGRAKHGRTGACWRFGRAADATPVPRVYGKEERRGKKRESGEQRRRSRW
jgi:hypothetical protein